MILVVFHLPSQRLLYANYRELQDPHRYVFQTVPCPQCQETAEITVDGPSLFRYHQGKPVQDCFPTLSPDDRERLFMTGICGSCFETLGGDDEPEADTT